MKKVLVLMLVFAMLFSVTAFAEKGGNGNGNAYGLEKENNAAWSRYELQYEGMTGSGSLMVSFEKDQFYAVVDNNGSLSNDEEINFGIYNDEDELIKTVTVTTDEFEMPPFALMKGEATFDEYAGLVKVQDFVNKDTGFDGRITSSESDGSPGTDVTLYRKGGWVSGTIVIINYDNGQVVLTLVKPDGEYVTSDSYAFNDISDISKIDLYLRNNAGFATYTVKDLKIDDTLIGSFDVEAPCYDHYTIIDNTDLLDDQFEITYTIEFEGDTGKGTRSSVVLKFGN